VGAPGTWGHVLQSNGMFVFSGLSRAQCEHLTRKWHIYLTLDGRMSLASLSEDKALYTAQAMKDALLTA
jgi:aspartate/tyrosine/aromatic aminotransferase